MNTPQAVLRLTQVIRRKNLASATERSYCAHLKTLPPNLPSEHKIERFLTDLATHGIAASTQNQAFNAVLFFYNQVLATQLSNIQALRVKRAVHFRHAPTPTDTPR